jgi:hypothetical protein
MVQTNLARAENDSLNRGAIGVSRKPRTLRMKTFTPAWRRETMRTRWGVVVLTGALAVVAVMLALAIGYLMNFQNLFEYWPGNGKLGDCRIEFVLSAAGVFVPPLGAFMGIFF